MLIDPDQTLNQPRLSRSEQEHSRKETCFEIFLNIMNDNIKCEGDDQRDKGGQKIEDKSINIVLKPSNKVGNRTCDVNKFTLLISISNGQSCPSIQL